MKLSHLFRRWKFQNAMGLTYTTLVVCITGFSILYTTNYWYTFLYQKHTEYLENEKRSFTKYVENILNRQIHALEDLGYLSQNTSSETWSNIAFIFMNRLPLVSNVFMTLSNGKSIIILRRYSPNYTKTKQETQGFRIIFRDEKGHAISKVLDQYGQETEGKIENTFKISDLRSHYWYHEARKNHTFYWSAPHMDSFDHLRTYRAIRFDVTCALPIHHSMNNTFLGVVGIDLETEKLSQLLYRPKRFQAIEEGMLITNNNQILIYHNEEKMFTSPQSHRTKIEKFVNNPKWAQQGFSPAWGKQMKLLIKMKPNFLKEAQRTFLIRTSIVSFILFLISLALILWISRQMAIPLKTTRDELDKIPSLSFNINSVMPTFFLESWNIHKSLGKIQTALGHISKFVPKYFLRYVIQNGLRENFGEKRFMTIMFSDIRDFTRITESMVPEHLLRLLSEYFDTLTQVIHTHHGIIDKYIGDAIMALWGGLHLDKNHAYHAARGALACCQALEECNVQWKEKDTPTLRHGIGLASGHVLLGTMGSKDRLQYTVLGDTVNIAARLEGLTTTYGVMIIVNHDFYTQVRDLCIMRPINRITIRGRTTPEVIYHLMASYTETHKDLKYLADQALRTQRAWQALKEENYALALEYYQNLLKNYPQDTLAQVMIQECEAALSPPPLSLPS